MYHVTLAAAPRELIVIFCGGDPISKKNATSDKIISSYLSLEEAPGVASCYVHNKIHVMQMINQIQIKPNCI